MPVRSIAILFTTAIPFLQGDVGFLFQTFLITTIIMAGVAYAFGDNSAGVHFLLGSVFKVYA